MKALLFLAKEENFTSLLLASLQGKWSAHSVVNREIRGRRGIDVEKLTKEAVKRTVWLSDCTKSLLEINIRHSSLERSQLTVLWRENTVGKCRLNYIASLFRRSLYLKRHKQRQLIELHRDFYANFLWRTPVTTRRRWMRNESFRVSHRNEKKRKKRNKRTVETPDDFQLPPVFG